MAGVATHRVTLKGFSGVHLRDGHTLRVEADGASTGPIKLVSYESEYVGGIPALLVADVYVEIIESHDPWSATVEAATQIVHDFHLFGVLFNAAVHEPEVTGVYELRSGGDFRQQTLSTQRPHGDISTRQVQAQTLLNVFGPIPRTLPDRLRAALMLYDYSLSALHPHRTLEAALRLYPAIEHLTVHLKREMQQDAGLSEKDHALSLGIDTSKDDWPYHYRGKIRRERIFTDRPEDFNVLRVARNDYEHASVDMETLRQRVSPVLESLYRQVRTALLVALPLEAAGLAVVNRTAFDLPLGNWPTQVAASGTFSGPSSAFNLDAPRLELDLDLGEALYQEIDFDPAAGTRRGQLTYTVSGTATKLPDGLSGQIVKTEVFSPNDLGAEVNLPRADTKQVLLNGQDITDTSLLTNPPGDVEAN